MIIDFFESPVGNLKIIATEKHITSISFVGNQTGIDSAENLITKKCKKQLQEYFDGKRKIFDIPFETKGTLFQKKVWEELYSIPFGVTKSYKDLAEMIGNPKAARAVGGALNKNPIGIIVPCHRVIGSNKKLTGFAGGLDSKEYLLHLEGY